MNDNEIRTKEIIENNVNLFPPKNDDNFVR